MAQTMIERVARAISQKVELGEDDWANFVPLAKAIIAAMREPTNAMLATATSINEMFDSNAAWRAMIDAALEEK